MCVRVSVMEGEFDNLFQMAKKESTDKPYNYADEIMESLEKEYLLPQTMMNEREMEKKELNLKMGTLKRKLHQNKNIKNSRSPANRTRADNRKKIREKIERIKDRLYEIQLEEQGSNISSKDLTGTL